MKKFVALLLVVSMLLCSAFALADGLKIGQVEFAAHGDKCFAVITAVVENDVIVACYIDEFQFMNAEGAVGVPNSDGSFGTSFPEGKVLISKRTNNALYSANMAAAGATNELVSGYMTIEAFCTGKTIAELEAIVAGTDKAGMLDVVTGATLVDTYGYVSGIIAAAKAAQ